MPYVLFMMVLAIPLVFLEFSYAQYSNLGPGRVWLCCPLFKGMLSSVFVWCNDWVPKAVSQYRRIMKI